MDKEDKTVVTVYMLTLIYDLLDIILFISLAIFFNMWYLSLLSIIFARFPQIKSKGSKDE